MKEKIRYLKNYYIVPTLNEDVLKMATGLATRDVFKIVVSYTEWFKDQINYFAGWRFESIRFEDLIFIRLMKVRQDYTNWLLRAHPRSKFPKTTLVVGT